MVIIKTKWRVMALVWFLAKIYTKTPGISDTALVKSKSANVKLNRTVF